MQRNLVKGKVTFKSVLLRNNFEYVFGFVDNDPRQAHKGRILADLRCQLQTELRIVCAPQQQLAQPFA